VQLILIKCKFRDLSWHIQNGNPEYQCKGEVVQEEVVAGRWARENVFIIPVSQLSVQYGAKLCVQSLLEANGRVAKLSEGWDV